MVPFSEMPFENNGEGDSEGIGVRTIYIFNRGSRGGSNKSTRLGGHWAGGPSFGLVVPSDMRFVQNFTPPEFQAKTFTPLISPNFNSFAIKTQKWRNLHHWQKFYTAGGSDGSDKSHLCVIHNKRCHLGIINLSY